MPEQANPYALPKQLWTTLWVPRRSSNFISLEDSIDAAIWDEAVDGLDNVPVLALSGLSVEHLAQQLLSEVKEAAKNHDFTKLLSKNREFNMYVAFWQFLQILIFHLVLEERSNELYPLAEALRLRQSTLHSKNSKKVTVAGFFPVPMTTHLSLSPSLSRLLWSHEVA